MGLMVTAPTLLGWFREVSDVHKVIIKQCLVHIGSQGILVTIVIVRNPVSFSLMWKWTKYSLEPLNVMRPGGSSHPISVRLGSNV